MLRRNRVYRFLRASLTIAAAVIRYTWLLLRDKLPVFKPTEASWMRAHRRTGRAVYRLATGLGGAFVKLGQVLGARADFFPEALIEPLRGLHDRVPARPFGQLRQHVEQELGRPISQVFVEISEEPIAAASLAQVHRARLAGGQEVVVKVQYPEARRLFPVDLASLERAVRVVRWLNKRIDLRIAVKELAEFVLLELDFARESESTERVRAAFDGDERVRVPEVHRDLCTDKLLVLEYIDGDPITEVDALREAGHDLRGLAERVGGIYCSMIFEHGFFHGDPHPGNLLVLASGQIGLLDFGLAKELPAGFATGVASLMVKGMAGDTEGAVAAARSVGFEIGEVDGAGLQSVLRMLLGDYRTSVRLVDVLQQSGIERVPSHFTLIVRVMILLNGLSHRLVPGERVIATALMRALAPHVARVAVA